MIMVSKLMITICIRKIKSECISVFNEARHQLQDVFHPKTVTLISDLTKSVTLPFASNSKVHKLKFGLTDDTVYSNFSYCKEKCGYGRLHLSFSSF